MESYSSNFKKQIPNIGIDRSLRLLSLTKEDSPNQTSPPNTLNEEDCIQMSDNNINKYKTIGCPIVYTSEGTSDSFANSNNNIDNIVTYNRLVDILHNDPNVYENFISKDKGAWIKEAESSLDIKDNSNLVIDSQFESGNLRYAFQVNKNEFDLVIRKDYNNDKNYSWFFFMIKSSIPRIIKMNFLNLTKKSILFSDAVRVLRYTDKDHWKRNTFNVYYYENGMPMPIIDNGVTDDKDKALSNNNNNNTTPCNTQVILDNSKKTFFSTLTFCYEITQAEVNFPIYFSYCYPYTYSSLQTYLYNLSLNSSYSKSIRFNTLGQTLCGNNLNIIYITCFNEDIGHIHQRPIIVFTARVHPGESNSSYIIESVINTLLSNDCLELRKKYMFKIIPMLNPDGVINGNYRSCIIGKDLNRMWQDPRGNSTPTIFSTKTLIISDKPEFYCDFHGHSSCSNATLYGCSPKKSMKGHSVSNLNLKNKKQYHHLEERIFMKIFEETSKFYDKSISRFTISKMKAKTARAVVYNELNVIYSYCLETSTMSTYKNDVYEPFTIQKYYQVGRDFVMSLNKMMTQKNIFYSTLKKVRVDDEEKKKEKERDKEKKESSLALILPKKPQKRNNDNHLMIDLNPYSLNNMNITIHNNTKPGMQLVSSGNNSSTISFSNKSCKDISHLQVNLNKKDKSGEQDNEKEESNHSSSNSYLTD